MPRLLVRLFLIILLTYGVASLAVPYMVKQLFKERIEQYSLSQYKGLVYLLEENLKAVPPAERLSRTQRLAENFAPGQIKLVAINQLETTADELDQLLKGQPIVHLDIYGMPDFIWFYIGDNQVIEMSVYIEQLDINLIYWFMNLLIGTALIGCVIFWWRPHWRALERLRTTARQLGQGDLSARTQMPIHSNLGELASVFDGMAHKLESLLTHQSDLLNAVSHELRTPLSRLDFGLALIAEAPMPKDIQQRVQDMKGHVRELNELVLELLSYTRLQAPQLTLEKTHLPLSEYLDSILGAFTEEMEEKGIVLDIRVTTSASVAIEPRMTARALQNLISNAVRYCNQMIRVTAVHDGNALQISVEDDGIGIPLDEREHIFTPFYRLDRSRDRATGGFGLGLSISRESITAQGGELYVTQSSLGGARFDIRLP